MVQKVRAAVLESREKMAIREFDMPEIGQDDGLLRVEMVGVCGTDPQAYKGKVASFNLPAILGHEILGRIAKIGDIASKRWKVKEGDRVILESFIRCGYCRNCLTGNYRFCENVRFFGGNISVNVPPHLWGAYAEYMYLPPTTIVYRISEKVPAEAGVLVNAVIANAIRWGRIVGDFCIGDAVVIQGAGPQGLAQVVVAKESGCGPIIVTGRSSDARSKRFELAKEFGADYVINVEREDVVQQVREITNGKMADVVVDVSGSIKATETSIDLVKVRGTVVTATHAGIATPIIVDKLVYRDIKFAGVYSSDSQVTWRAIKLVESGKYQINNIVSHKFPLEEAEKGVRIAGGYLEDIYPVKCVIIP